MKCRCWCSCNKVNEYQQVLKKELECNKKRIEIAENKWEHIINQSPHSKLCLTHSYNQYSRCYIIIYVIDKVNIRFEFKDTGETQVTSKVFKNGRWYQKKIYHCNTMYEMEVIIKKTIPTTQQQLIETMRYIWENNPFIV